MSVWQYTAIDRRSGARRRGLLVAAAASDVRASLRRVGLLVLEVRPDVATAIDPGDGPARPSPAAQVAAAIRRRLRARRRARRAELYDSLATLLEAGVPLVEAVQVALEAARADRARRAMLARLRADLRSGSSLADAMRRHDGWFDDIEQAMVRAGQLTGELPAILRTLARRHERADAFTQRLVAALAYPALVAAVGIGVTVFLSLRTLPQLVTILEDAGLESPPLTRGVMTAGQFAAGSWPILLAGLALVAGVIAVLRGRAASSGAPWFRVLRRLRPRLLHRAAAAGACRQLADLLRAGVPLVEALRAVAPTVTRGGLGRELRVAAEQVERGDDFADVAATGRWLDIEGQRLLVVARQGGDLAEVLARIGEREQRRAHRRLDRLAALLEPAVMLALAALVGTVVMAAVLPLLRLQEIIR